MLQGLKQIVKKAIHNRQKTEIKKVELSQLNNEIKQAIQIYGDLEEDYELIRIKFDKGDNRIPKRIEEILKQDPFYEEGKITIIIKVQKEFATLYGLFFRDVLPTSAFGILVEALVFNGSVLALVILPNYEIVCLPLNTRQTFLPLATIDEKDLTKIDLFDAQNWKSAYYDLLKKFEDYQDDIGRSMEVGIGLERFKTIVRRIYFKPEVRIILKFAGVPILLFVILFLIAYYFGIITIPLFEPMQPPTNSTRS